MAIAAGATDGAEDRATDPALAPRMDQSVPKSARIKSGMIGKLGQTSRPAAVHQSRCQRTPSPVVPSADTAAPVQNAAAGMSLIGHID